MRHTYPTGDPLAPPSPNLLVLRVVVRGERLLHLLVRHLRVETDANEPVVVVVREPPLVDVAPPDRDALLHGLGNEAPQGLAHDFYVVQPRVLPVLALDELEEAQQPLLQNVELVEERLDVEYEVAVLGDLLLTVRKPAHVELDVPHRVERGLNLGEVVREQLVVVRASRPLLRRRRRPDLEDVLVDLRHQEVRLLFRLEPADHGGKPVVHEGRLELVQPLERGELEFAHFGSS